MRRKHLSIIIGTAMGLAVAAPGTLLAAGMDGEQAGAEMQPDAQMGMDQAAQEQADSLMQSRVADLKGKPLVSPDGTNLGEVSDIVQSKDDQSLHAVIAVGGLLGVGENRVTYPVDQLELQDDQIVASTPLTQDDLEQRTAYNADDFESVGDTRTLAEAGDLGPSPEAEIAAFEDIDQDGDGFISEQEAQEHDRLSQNWQQYDEDSDQQLDRSEFSAFESDMRSEDVGELASFDEVDENGDGYISREEAQKHEDIVSAWQDVDVNSDDQLDEAEFSAFEAGWEAAAPEQRMQPDSGRDSGTNGMGGDTGATE